MLGSPYHLRSRVEPADLKAWAQGLLFGARDSGLWVDQFGVGCTSGESLWVSRLAFKSKGFGTPVEIIMSAKY